MTDCTHWTGTGTCHACRLEEAHDVIRELAEALRATDIRHTDFCGSDACSGCFMDGLRSAALARVNELNIEEEKR